MSTIDWKPVFDSLIALGAFLAYVAVILEVVLHYADLKRQIMKPNFQLRMYPKGSYAGIMVTNDKTGNPLRDWRVCDATDCEGWLAIKNHETIDDSAFDVKERTPLRWEGEGKILKRMSVSPLPAHLQAFEYDSTTGGVHVRIYDEGEFRVSILGLVPPTVDVFVQVQSEEGTVAKWLRGVNLAECIKKGEFPEFVDPP